MTDFVDLIADYLTAQGLAGGTTGWTIHKWRSRDTPDQIVAIFYTGGPEPEIATDRSWWKPSFQLMVRGAKNAGPALSNAKAEQLLTALHGAAIAGFAWFRASGSGPITIGLDVDGRDQFTINFRSGEA